MNHLTYIYVVSVSFAVIAAAIVFTSIMGLVG